MEWKTYDSRTYFQYFNVVLKAYGIASPRFSKVLFQILAEVLGRLCCCIFVF